MPDSAIASSLLLRFARYPESDGTTSNLGASSFVNAASAQPGINGSLGLEAAIHRRYNRCPTLPPLLASTLATPLAFCGKAGACGIFVVRDWLPHFFLQVLNSVSQLSRAFEV